MRPHKKVRVLPLGLGYRTDDAAILHAWRCEFLCQIQAHCPWVVKNLADSVLPEYRERYYDHEDRVSADPDPTAFHQAVISSWERNLKDRTDPLRESIRQWVRRSNLLEIKGSKWNGWLVRQVLHICHGWMIEDEPLWAAGEIPSDFRHMAWAHLLRPVDPTPMPAVLSAEYSAWNGEPLPVYEEKLTRWFDMHKRIAMDRAREQASKVPAVEPILRPQRFAALALHLCLNREEAIAKNLVRLDEVGYFTQTPRVLQGDLRELKRLLGLKGLRGKRIGVKLPKPHPPNMQ